MAGIGRAGPVLVAGSANIDFVVRVPHNPAPGETVLGGAFTMVPGGKGANQAVAAARAGAATSFLAAMGDDPFAAVLTRSLEDAGVTLLQMASDQPTGAALITVSDDAENAIAVAPGANMALAPGDLPNLADTAWLVMQLETPLATVAAYAAAARQAGTAVLLNAAPAQPLPRELLAQVDVLIANEEELAGIAAGETIAARLAAAGVACAVVTLGGRGCCALVDGTFHCQPAFAVTPIDTTAAGDSFCGALVAALAEGRGIDDALRFAAAAGALATTEAGAQTSIPRRPAIDALLADVADDAAALAVLKDYCGIAA